MNLAEQDLAQRQRMQALLESTTLALEQAMERVGRQRRMVLWLEGKGHPSLPARRLFDQMAEIVETYRWQQAWIAHHLKRTTYVTLEGQPHPWDTRPSAHLLADICTELREIVRAEPSLADPEATWRAVDAVAMRQAMRRQGG